MSPFAAREPTLRPIKPPRTTGILPSLLRETAWPANRPPRTYADVRRIAANIAKLPKLLCGEMVERPQTALRALVKGFRGTPQEWASLTLADRR
jgi:hypothetical protein